MTEGRVHRWVAIAAASLLVTGIASIGQVQHDLSVAARGDKDDTEAATPTSAPAGSAPVDAASSAEGAASGPGAAKPAGGRPTGTGVTPGGTSTAPPPGVNTVPDFGLHTQGVTDSEVKIGVSYDKAQCGDTGTLAAMLGQATTGDVEKSMKTYVRYVNDSGGIRGRELKVVFADDGGPGCPEKNLAAARQLADDEKVFMAFPGLHVESDYIASRNVPVFGGRDDPASLARYGANGINLIQDIGGNLNAWAAFGRHYLDSANATPCLLRPESGASGDWDAHEGLLTERVQRFGFSFKDTVVYQEDVSTAQQQANAAVARMKTKGCDQVWFMAGNPIALIFFTQAATQNLWFPTWTFTSYTVLADTELGGRLMDQRQWENAVGLSTRIRPGEHPKEGNCKRIYEQYNGNDGQSESAYAQLACAMIMSATEAMNRAIDRTGILTANSLLVGADAMGNDYFYDAHVPIDWSFPSPAGPFKTKGWSHYTVVDWDSSGSEYLFPEFPTYWQVMGPGKSGGVDIRSYYQQG